MTALITRPGAVAREYVEGKRRRHYGPFATLAVLVGLAALAVNVADFERSMVPFLVKPLGPVIA